MNKKGIMQELENILLLSQGSLSPDTGLDEVIEWDSMSKLSFMAYARKDFGKRVTIEKLNKFLTVKDLCDYLLEEK